MSESPVVHIGENSPEQVALKLYLMIDGAEDSPRRTRREILDLYSECLYAVTHPNARGAAREKSVSR
jgi:hypothetical protein